MDNSKVQEDFLMARRSVTSTVNVISAKLNEERHAMTATSVASLSLSPPAMIICVNKEASIHNILRKDKKFVINVLSNKQQNLSESCSNTEEGESRFKDEGWVAEDDIVFNENSKFLDSTIFRDQILNFTEKIILCSECKTLFIKKDMRKKVNH